MSGTTTRARTAGPTAGADVPHGDVPERDPGRGASAAVDHTVGSLAAGGPGVGDLGRGNAEGGVPDDVGTALRDSTALRLTVPAKVNLALHVLGRRTDGYHELQSLVAFAAIDDGDVVEVGFGPPAEEAPAFTVSGRFGSSVPAGPENLAAAAARHCPQIRAVHLVKGLPVAAGIGGGSADAAAVLRAAAHRYRIDPASLAADALSLGADVPVCLDGRPCLMEGIGEKLTPVDLPAIHAILINPGRPLATADVFGNLATPDNAPFMPPSVGGLEELFAWLRTTRNDLEGPAHAAMPEIGTLLQALRSTDGCRIARMSGSGPTVFGLYDDAASRDGALDTLRARAPQRWWIRAARFAAGTEPVPLPQPCAFPGPAPR